MHLFALQVSIRRRREFIWLLDHAWFSKTYSIPFTMYYVPQRAFSIRRRNGVEISMSIRRRIENARWVRTQLLGNNRF